MLANPSPEEGQTRNGMWPRLTVSNELGCELMISECRELGLWILTLLLPGRMNLGKSPGHSKAQFVHP